MSSEIHNNTNNGQCSKCGECCGLFIPFTESELKKIIKYVKQNNIEPTDRIDIQGNMYANCCFYDRYNRKCNIYPVRPYVCKDFICSRIDWKEKREIYENRAKYNSSTTNTKILATFDDKIYGDYVYIIRYISDICKDENGNLDSERFINALKSINRTDILNHMKVTLEDGTECEGTDLENTK